MNVELLFRLAGVGILVAILNQLLTKAGKEDIAMLVSIVGLIVCLFLVVDLTGNLLNTVKQVFQLY